MSLMIFGNCMSLELLEKFTRHRPIFYKSLPSISNKKREVTQSKQSEPVENKPAIKKNLEYSDR